MNRLPEKVRIAIVAVTWIILASAMILLALASLNREAEKFRGSALSLKGAVRAQDDVMTSVAEISGLVKNKKFRLNSDRISNDAARNRMTLLSSLALMEKASEESRNTLYRLAAGLAIFMTGAIVMTGRYFTGRSG